MMKEIVVREFSDLGDKWNRFAEAHAEAKIYHLYPWRELIKNTFGHDALYLAAYSGEEILGILPLIRFRSAIFGRFLISMPFFNYGGELTNSTEVLPAFHSFLSQYVLRNDLRFAELRHDHKLESNLPFKQHKVTFLLPLPDDPEVLLKSFKAKVRSQIKRPIKEKMDAKAGGLELLDDFYKVFARNMRDLGTPVYPKKFFKNILNYFPEYARLVIVYTSEGVPVAASFLLGYRETMEIPWASSLREYNRFSPNMLLYWKSFQEAIRQGYKQFDFGRCTPGSGTHRFKKQWGGIEKPLFWYYVLPSGGELPEINPQNPRYALAIKLWQKLPVGLSKILGPPIIKNIP